MSNWTLLLAALTLLAIATTFAFTISYILNVCKVSKVAGSIILFICSAALFLYFYALFVTPGGLGLGLAVITVAPAVLCLGISFFLAMIITLIRKKSS